ncbi:MAG: sigma-54 dependent transcriptional regulator [candidate division NC10 bacterium]|nr:sigma-54 dependent transcriptional regulator [candidate division NC10 bacterium]
MAISLKREGYEVEEAPGGTEALLRLEREIYDLVMTDLKMAPVGGLEVLAAVKKSAPQTEVIVMTAYGSIEAAVDAMRLGAFDFVTKPFQAEEILARVRNALEKTRLTTEVRLLRGDPKSRVGFEHLLGQSPAMQAVLEKAARVAVTESTILITGESGTGKELVARAIHARSLRASKPFVSVNCAAFPEQLLESELFGHIKGAFTGAVASRKGLLEEAHGGTFFFDEVGDTPPGIQAKLLRVLEDRVIRRLGDNRPIRVDVRILAATNRDLPAAIREKAFREDLYYRLNVVALHLPPLRARSEDIPLLAQHFLAVASRRMDKAVRGFTEEVLGLLRAYDYPGNIRELENAVEQAMAFTTGSLIRSEDLPEALRGGPRATEDERTPGPGTLEEMERDLILRRIRDLNGNLSLAARALGIGRTTLWRKMKAYRIEPAGR